MYLLVPRERQTIEIETYWLENNITSCIPCFLVSAVKDKIQCFKVPTKIEQSLVLELIIVYYFNSYINCNYPLLMMMMDLVITGIQQASSIINKAYTTDAAVDDES